MLRFLIWSWAESSCSRLALLPSCASAGSMIICVGVAFRSAMAAVERRQPWSAEPLSPGERRCPKKKKKEEKKEKKKKEK